MWHCLQGRLEIDIAVDLGGFTQNLPERQYLLCQQHLYKSVILVTLGQWELSYYDYLVADQTIIPEERSKIITQKKSPIYRVIKSMIQRNLSQILVFTRQDLGLPEAGFVFCCFNNIFKITPTSFDSWGRILEQVDGSVLTNLCQTMNQAKINLTKEIALRGIDL